MILSALFLRRLNTSGNRRGYRKKQDLFENICFECLITRYVRGTRYWKISVKLGGKIIFRVKIKIKVLNVDIYNGDYETPCSMAFCSVTEVTSFSRQAGGCSEDMHFLMSL